MFGADAFAPADERSMQEAEEVVKGGLEVRNRRREGHRFFHLTTKDI
jgi:hypothetical protein